MKVERTYGPENKIIYCNVPTLIPANLLLERPNWIFKPGLEGRYGNFSLYLFMSRYMAGHRSLREARKVSRKQLALVGSEVGYMEPEAYNLYLQMQRFNNALNVFTKSPTLTEEVVLEANKALATETVSTGEIRCHQNWVGSTTPFDARYVCPPPEMVPKLFTNWTNFINDDSIEFYYRAIIGHCQLGSIHPFVEGNGRTARVFMESMLRRQLGDRIPLMTYRLSPNCPTAMHLDMQERFNNGDSDSLSHPFWTDAIAWNQQLQNKVKLILDNTRRKINAKIGLNRFSPTSAKLMDYLWGQPVVSKIALMKLFVSDISRIQPTLDELIRLGLIETRLLKEPKNAVIFDCPLIFEAYAAIDEAIFEK